MCMSGLFVDTVFITGYKSIFLKFFFAKRKILLYVNEISSFNQNVEQILK